MSTPQYNADLIENLRLQADQMEPGPQQIAIWEKAVREADAEGSAELGFHLRQELIRYAFTSGAADRLLTAITWNLAKADQEEERYLNDTLLWQCKHVLSWITSFPEISREQISGITENIISRYQRSGISLRPILMFQSSNMISLGDRELAAPLWEDAIKHPADRFSEGPEWELHFEIGHLMEFHGIEKALARAQPFLEGRWQDSNVSPWVIQRFLTPLVKMGKLEDAAKYHQRAYSQIRRNPRFLSHVGGHLMFLVLTDNLPQALRLFERHMPSAWRSPVPGKQFSFYLKATFLVEHLVQRGQTHVDLQLPAALPVAKTADGYLTAELAAWFKTQTEALAERFNQRNGNERYSQFIRGTSKLHDQVNPFPLGDLPE